MSAIYRYQMLKKYYNNYLVLLIKNNNFISYNIDKNILLSLNSKKNIIIQLEKKNISYIIVENTTIMKKYDSNPNDYNKYFYKECLYMILDTIKGKYLLSS